VPGKRTLREVNEPLYISLHNIPATVLLIQLQTDRGCSRIRILDTAAGIIVDLRVTCRCFDDTRLSGRNK
jgi:hypothetical protein